MSTDPIECINKIESITERVNKRCDLFEQQTQEILSMIDEASRDLEEAYNEQLRKMA